MTSSEKRILLPLLRKVSNGEKLNHRMQSAAEQMYAKLTRPKIKSKGGRLRREQKQAAHKEETKAIHEAVFNRANGRCEAPGCAIQNPILELDHWLGGSGRRREQQSVETCWMLCRIHHGARTKNIGSAAYWNARFAQHCERYGYSFTPHITHAQLKRSAP